MKNYFGFIYEWIDSTNNKNYIGSHAGLINDSYTGSGTKFLNAYKKRPEKFTRKILEYVYEDNREILLEMEQKYLDLIDWSNTYNISTIARGSNGPKGPFTEEHKQNISKSRKQGIQNGTIPPHPHTGKIWDEIYDEETIDAMKENLRQKCGRTGFENSFYGKSHTEKSKKLMGPPKGNIPWDRGAAITEERRKNISAAKKGKPWSIARRKAYENSKYSIS